MQEYIQIRLKTNYISFTFLNALLKLANDGLCLIERSNLFQSFEAKFVEDQCPQFLLDALLRILFLHLVL